MRLPPIMNAVAALAAFMSPNGVGPASPAAPLEEAPANDQAPTTPITPLATLSNSLANVLEGSIQVNAAGNLTRLTGNKRPYSLVNRVRKMAPLLKPKPPRPSIESISNGSHFDRSKTQVEQVDVEVEDMNKHSCCGRKCNEEWDAEALSRARSALVPYGKGTQTARKTYVRGCFASETRQLHVKDGLNAFPVCWMFYRALMGVSFDLLKSAGGVGPVHMKRRDPVNTTAHLIAVWLRELASHWEMQPDKDEIHMSFPDAKMVYNMFCMSAPMAAFCRAPPVYQYFMYVWNRDCSNIKLKKDMRFTKCDVCTLANEALDVERRKGGMGWMTEEMEKIKKHLEDHYEDVKRSRAAYMMAKMIACTNPLVLLCIAIDGADQSAFSTPFFSQETKDTVKGWKMRLKLIGCLVSGRMCMFYTLGSNWESGSNLTIQVLHSTLLKLMDGLEEGQRLPRRLWLQMDNCSRENKNRYFLAYLHLLVQYGVFDIIELHFGLKGHTHDEIDQIFSRISIGLRKLGAATRSLLGVGVTSSYRKGSPNFHVGLQHLNNCANVRDLVKHNMYPIPRVTAPQAFKVSKDPSDGLVTMQVQARSYRDEWGVINREGEYGPGRMTIMRNWPDLRDTPPHPRKAIPDHTLSQHRLCIEAAGPRIKVGCNNVAQLPEGHTAEMLYERRMQELADEVVEVGKSTDVAFDWDLSLYPHLVQLPTVSPAASAMGGAGAGPTPVGVVPPRANRIVFHVEVGEFVALPTPPNDTKSISVGKVLSVASGDGGDEVTLHWFMPVRVPEGCRRSQYGKGRWTEEFLIEDGKRVPFIGSENIAAVSSKFLTLTSQGKVPKHAWRSVAESTQPGAESDHEEDEEGEEEEEEEEDRVEAGITEAAGPVLPSPPLLAPPLVVAPLPRVERPRVEPPPGVQRAAAYYRPRRDGAAPNLEPTS